MAQKRPAGVFGGEKFSLAANMGGVADRGTPFVTFIKWLRDF